jgi:hypothetical protein
VSNQLDGAFHGDSSQYEDWRAARALNAAICQTLDKKASLDKFANGPAAAVLGRPGAPWGSMNVSGGEINCCEDGAKYSLCGGLTLFRS